MEPEPAVGALRALLEIDSPEANDRWGGLELVHTKQFQFHSLWVCGAGVTVPLDMPVDCQLIPPSQLRQMPPPFVPA
jgi:hypothetical protein